MAENKNFFLLRKILKILGLSPEAIDDIVQRIEDILYGAKKQLISIDSLINYGMIFYHQPNIVFMWCSSGL